MVKTSIKTLISIYPDDDVLERLRKLADKNKRSLNAQILFMLEQKLKEEKKE